MPDNAQQDDELVITLVEQALAQPLEAREAYLRGKCGASQELFEQAWNYVQWEQRMGRFLLDPIYVLTREEDAEEQVEEDGFQPGELLENRFRVLREVAQGGMGIVYEAVDEKLDRRIAIKCAKFGFRKRLPPEVRHASEVSHPNVCKIFEIHTARTSSGEVDFVTMEYLDGETLAERLRRGPLPVAEARSIGNQVCLGLQAAHNQGVIHGDLKSGNVILTKSADGTTRAAITDFGMARARETSQATVQSGPRGGTPDYMAPELWKGERATFASDVYALGVLLREVAGAEASAFPKAVVARCLAKDPQDRYPSGSEVVQALQPSHTRRWVLAVAAAAVLTVGTGVLTYLRTVTPRETVKLAVLPFESTSDTAALGEKLSADSAGQIGRLNAGPRVKLTVIPPAAARRKNVDSPEKGKSVLGASHVLQGALEIRNGKTILHAYVTDARTLVHLKDLTAEYASSETRYVPVALAGMVTETFHLPAQAAAVNPAAAKDYWAGLYYIRRNSTVDKALPLLERAVKTDPDSPLTFAALAEAEYWKFTITRERMWLNRSAESVRQAELRNPDLAQVHRVSGLHKRQAGWYDQAAADYRRAIELDPTNGDAYRRLGIVQEASNQMDLALASYLRAIEVAPANYHNYQDLGSYYDKQGKYSEAIPYYRKAAELAPEEPSGHFALGTIYLKLGLFGESEREFSASLAQGETPSALHSLGYALMYDGKDSDAIPYINHALEKGPEKYLWWMNLGIAYRRTHQLAKSEHANRRGLELAQEELNKNTRNGYVRSCSAYLCARLNEQERAGSEIKQGLHDSPKDADVQFNAVATYLALDQPEDAIRILRESPVQVLADVSRFPDLADLRKNSRFLEMLASHGLK